jgi:hypothetical protein
VDYLLSPFRVSLKSCYLILCNVITRLRASLQTEFLERHAVHSPHMTRPVGSLGADVYIYVLITIAVGMSFPLSYSAAESIGMPQKGVIFHPDKDIPDLTGKVIFVTGGRSIYFRVFTPRIK